MKYVLDASVALKWVVPESGHQEALDLREDYRTSIHALLAADILLGEVAHTLTKMERRQIIPFGHSQLFLDDILTTCPDLHSYLPLLDRAREISSLERVGFFDCLYVALAERETCELVTADQRLISNLGNRYPIKGLADL